MSYEEFAHRLSASGIITDPWIDGQPRFRAAPVWIPQDTARSLFAAAEAVAEAHHQVALRCAENPAWLDWLGLSPFQRLMWTASAPSWHGVARADVFLTATGPQVCELNSDTPSGQAETVLTSQLAHEDFPHGENPNVQLEARYCRLLELLCQRDTGKAPRTIGILYPTEMTEDLSMVELYRRWFSARGWEVVLGSPYNLRVFPKGRIGLFDTPCDVLVRHYKTDWWGERLPVWKDDPGYLDKAPLSHELDLVLGAWVGRKVAVVNPFGAVVTQNKRAMALLWEELATFPPATQEKVRRYVPFTVRLESAPLEELRREKDAWVLKSDYGCEGDEVVIGRECSPEEWAEALDQAVPGRWAAQRYFEALGETPDEPINYGVYLVGGRASGLFLRVQPGHTDTYALSAPALLFPEER